MTLWSIENEWARKLDDSNEVDILRMSKLVNEHFNFSELSNTFFQTSDFALVLVTTLFFFQSFNLNIIQAWMILFQQKNQCIRSILFN